MRHRVALAENTRIDYQVKVALSPRGPVPATLLPADGVFTSSTVRGTIRELVRIPA
jgi:hypothetical protein